MGHAGPRTNTNVLNYNIGEMNKCFSLEGGIWVFHPERVTPARAQSLGEMLGGMNSDYNKQYPDTPFPTDPESGGTTPPQPPTSGDPFADLKFRMTVGSHAAFHPAHFTESNALKAAYPDQEKTIQQLNGYYGPGGYGNFMSWRSGNTFTFDNFIAGTHDPDVDGAADKFAINQPGNAMHVAPPVFVFP